MPHQQQRRRRQRRHCQQQRQRQQRQQRQRQQLNDDNNLLLSNSGEMSKAKNFLKNEKEILRRSIINWSAKDLTNFCAKEEEVKVISFI